MTAPAGRCLTEAEFTAIARRASLRLTPEKCASLYETYCSLAELAQRVRRPRDLGAEPAVVFSPLGAKRP